VTVSPLRFLGGNVPYTGALLQYRAVAGAGSHSVSSVWSEIWGRPSLGWMSRAPREVAGKGIEEERTRREFEPELDKDKEEGMVNPSLLAIVVVVIPNGSDDEDELDGFLDSLDDEPPGVEPEPESESGPLIDILSMVGV
jgi:hypothetical protein